ncbi:hypothetical protein BJ742DRAFT_858713 [Cladochytrium replicatum]|nr:hypothetical protein BJ742DRAFT_858713 [Cladochytrium replicatum]
MGCGASKGMLAVAPETASIQQNTVTAFPTNCTNPAQVIPVTSDPRPETCSVSLGTTLSKPVVPSIAPAKPVSDPARNTKDEGAVRKPVAFEIPLDCDVFKKSSTKNIAGAPPTGASCIAQTKVSLPKLELTAQDLQAKLANTEARWKEMDSQQEARRSSRGKSRPPQLTSSTRQLKPTVDDPVTLKQRMLEKEQQVAQNRIRGMEKLQAKLARQEVHARQVQERKRNLGRLSNEDLNVSWGGEMGLSDALKGAGAVIPAIAKSADSGKGSSSVSLPLGSRSGSGRSNGTAVDIGSEDGEASQAKEKSKLPDESTPLLQPSVGLA